MVVCGVFVVWKSDAAAADRCLNDYSDSSADDDVARWVLVVVVEPS